MSSLNDSIDDLIANIISTAFAGSSLDAQRGRDRIETAKQLIQAKYDLLRAEVERLREALSEIRQYGSDTLSGRADGGPDDRGWQRDGVREMTRRARIALGDAS